MSFEKIQSGKYRGGRETLTNTVSVSAYATTGSAVIYISNNIYERIGSPLYAFILIGSGEDAGKICIQPTTQKDGAYKIIKPKNGRGSVRIGLSPKRLGLPKGTPTTRCHFVVSDNGLIVTLPATNVMQVAAE